MNRTCDRSCQVRPQRRTTRIRSSIARPVVYSLCDATGNWARPYADAGFDVRLVDLVRGEDVRFLEWPGCPVYAVLGAPPCTLFSRARGRAPSVGAELARSLEVVAACVRFIVAVRPMVWALENPPGQLDRWLGPPAFSFQPCDYGDAWTKRTFLWGKFNVPVPRPVVPAACGVDGRGGRPALGWSAAERSATPSGFAQAFFAANSGGVVVPGVELWESRVVGRPRW